MRSDVINIGVIGLGEMGSNHLRVLNAIPDVRIAAIADPDENKREKYTDMYRVPAVFPGAEEFAERAEVDGVVVAIPPKFNLKVASAVLQMKKPVLLEKPIAHSMECAAGIVEAAKKAEATVLIGHVERFNPVVKMALEFIGNGTIGKPYLINTRRNGPFPKRLLKSSVGVLIDLAVHDIDIIQHLSGKLIKDVETMLIKSENQEIHATINFRCEGGPVGNLEFSWISPQKIRSMSCFGIKGLLEADYISQSLKVYENVDVKIGEDPWSLKMLSAGHVMAGKIVEYPIWKSEPLRLEHEHFLRCIKGLEKPEVTPEAAAQVLSVVQKAIEANDRSNTSINYDF